MFTGFRFSAIPLLVLHYKVLLQGSARAQGRTLASSKRPILHAAAETMVHSCQNTCRQGQCKPRHGKEPGTEREEGERLRHVLSAAHVWYGTMGYIHVHCQGQEQPYETFRHRPCRVRFESSCLLKASVHLAPYYRRTLIPCTTYFVEYLWRATTGDEVQVGCAAWGLLGQLKGLLCNSAVPVVTRSLYAVLVAKRR